MKNQLISAAIINLILLQTTSAGTGSFLTTKDINCSAPHNTSLDFNEIMGPEVPRAVQLCINIICFHGKVVTSVKSEWCQDNLPTIANQKSMGDTYEVEAQESLTTTKPSLISTEDRITATRISTTTKPISTTLKPTSTIKPATRSTKYPLRFTVNPTPIYKSTTEEPYDYADDEGESENSGDEDEIHDEDDETNSTGKHIESTTKDDSDQTEESETTVSATIAPTRYSFAKTKPTTTTSTTTRQSSPKTTTSKPIITESTTSKPSTTRHTTSKSTTPEPSTIEESTSPAIVTRQFIKNIPRILKTIKKTTKKSNPRKIPKLNQEEINLYGKVAEVRVPDESSSLLLKHLPISISDMFILILFSLAFFIVFFVAVCVTYCIKKVFYKKEKVQVVVDAQRHRLNMSNYNFDV